MVWTKEDLNNYNQSESPWFNVNDNGKVDICDKIGMGERRISLYPWGMYKLTHEWLKSGHNLSREEKNNLIKLLK